LAVTSTRASLRNGGSPERKFINLDIQLDGKTECAFNGEKTLLKAALDRPNHIESLQQFALACAAS